MVNTFQLKAEILRSSLSMKEIAAQIGISSYSLYKKINNITEFKASEIAALSQILSIENKDAIFFTQW